MQSVELYDELMAAGVSRESVIRFDEDATPRHIRYLDLLIRSGDSDTICPDAVVESSGHPYLYVVRRDRLGDSSAVKTSLATLIRVLACRSDARFLAVVKPGSIDVYPVGLFESVPAPLLSDSTAKNSPELRALLSGLTVGSNTSQVQSSTVSKQWLEALLFRLLTDAAHGIRQAAPKLTAQQVIALVGRALFFRFLVDRGIVREKDVATIGMTANGLVDMFSTPANLAKVCSWMDITFNGDLLSIGGKDYQALMVEIGEGLGEVCRHLSSIQYRAFGGQLPLDWGGIEFKHVPVDMLSQVYEDFAHEFVPTLAQATSIHFTPRRLAEIVLDGAFSALGSVSPHEARVLDPAVGGGVFLVLAFRRLVAERWRATGSRPTRAVIRKILRRQLAGFDINRDALNITALSLYLAALELDPTPSPLTELKFEKLIGTVLHPVDKDGLGRDDDDALLGSLSTSVLNEYEGCFDVVVGNPPWTGFKGMSKDALNKKLAQLTSVAEVQAKEDLVPQSLRARYGSPDIPFLLAASKWAKPGGALGFVLHARFMFQPKAFELRKYVFKSVRVTGIMNFSALSQDPRLWPSNSAPFMLLVARNELPNSDDNFYFISPKYEPQLSVTGQFRIDPCAATPISLASVQEDPFALRAIYKGGLAGANLLKRVRVDNPASIGEFLLQRHGVQLSNGYQLGRPNKRTVDATHLFGLPIVTTDVSPFGTGGANDEIFLHPLAEWPREPSIFKSPVLLFRASPKRERHLRGALLYKTDVAYTNAFFGLSIAEHPGLEPLADLLNVLSYSEFFLYFQLLTSPKFGVERKSSLQADIEDFPLVSFDVMTPIQIAAVRAISNRLQQGESCWTQVDEFVSDLYHLSVWDRQLIQDTLEFELPFIENVQRASFKTTPEDRLAFVDTFNTLIKPFSEDDDSPMRIFEVNTEFGDGWRYVCVARLKERGQKDTPFSDIDPSQFSALAQSYWASRLTVELSGDCAIVGQLDQRRYWSKTQARLLALEWIQSGHLPN